MKPRRVWKGLPPHFAIEDDASIALSGLDAANLVVFAGAGISAQAPASLPTAIRFLQAFYDVCLPRSCDRTRLFPDPSPYAAMRPQSGALRFEAAMGVVQHRFDRELDLLDVFAASRANQNHRCLDELSRRGALIITTNFDTLIEDSNDRSRYTVRAADRDFEDVPAEVRGREVWHLHGVVSDRDTIVASVRDCWKSRDLFRLDRAKGEALARVLAKRDLLVVGYSGSDDFDIAPALESAPSERRVVWVHHTPGEHDVVLPDGITPLVREYLADGTTWYRAAAANTLATMIGDDMRRADRVVLLRHETGRVLVRLAGLEDSPSPRSHGLDLQQYFAGWRERHRSDEASRYLLAVLLCNAAGDEREVERLLGEFHESVLPRLKPPDIESEAAAVFDLILMSAVKIRLSPITITKIAGIEQLLKEQPALAAAFQTADARRYADAGRIDEATAAATESLRIRRANQLNDGIEVAEYDLALALFHRDYPSDTLQEAADMAEASRRSAVAATNPEGVARAALLLARIHERVEDTLNALEWYLTACDAAFHSGLDSLHAESHGEMGIFLWINGESLDDWVASAEYLGEAFRIHDRLQEWPSLKIVSSHLALCHEALGHLDQSLLADCVAFNCASGLGERDTASIALRRIKARAPEVLGKRVRKQATDEELVTHIHKMLIEDGVGI